MSVIWAFLRPMIGPLLLVAGALAALWLVYSEGKDCRTGCADAIASCEQRRAEDHAALMAERESLLAQRTTMLQDALNELEEVKRENEKRRSAAERADSNLRAARAALDAYRASLRFQSADGGGAPVPGTDGAGGTDASTAERGACPAAFENRCAQDALTVFRWQDWYRTLKEK